MCRSVCIPPVKIKDFDIPPLGKGGHRFYPTSALHCRGRCPHRPAVRGVEDVAPYGFYPTWVHYSFLITHFSLFDIVRIITHCIGYNVDKR